MQRERDWGRCGKLYSVNSQRQWKTQWCPVEMNGLTAHCFICVVPRRRPTKASRRLVRIGISIYGGWEQPL